MPRYRCLCIRPVLTAPDTQESPTVAFCGAFSYQIGILSSGVVKIKQRGTSPLLFGFPSGYVFQVTLIGDVQKVVKRGTADMVLFLNEIPEDIVSRQGFGCLALVYLIYFFHP